MPTLSTDEQELLRQAQAGDAPAFHALIRPYVPLVRRFAMGFCRDPSDADDLAQEALIRAYRALRGFRGQSALSTWLFTVTRSTCLDYLRSRQGRSRQLETALDEGLPDEGDAQDQLYGQKCDAEQLWQCIRRLDARFRVPLILYDIEGLSYEQIATIERVPVGTVRSRLARARQQLRQLVTSATPGVSPPFEGTATSEAPSNMTRRPA